MESFNLRPSIKQPTRVTAQSCSTISNLEEFEANIASPRLSDHEPLVLTTSMAATRIQSNPSVSRKINQYTIETFLAALGAEDWTTVKQESCVSKQFQEFLGIFVAHVNAAFPKSKRRSSKKQSQHIPELQQLEETLGLIHDSLKQRKNSHLSEMYMMLKST